MSPLEELVPTERTPMDPFAVYAALRLASGLTTRAALLTLMAQWSHETGNGASSNNWNLGGLKYTPGCGHNYAQYLTGEVFGGKSVVVPQKFRAYDNLDDAAIDYVRELRHTFAYAWPAVEAGDVSDFAHRLKARGYYTAPEEAYAAGLQRRYAQLDALIPEDTKPDAPQAIAVSRPVYVLPDPLSPEVDDPTDEPA